jgi:transposase
VDATPSGRLALGGAGDRGNVTRFSCVVKGSRKARFRDHLFARARGGAAQSEVAREEATTRYQVEQAFRLGAAGELVERTPPVRRLALDEAAHRRGSRALATVVCDIDRRRVVDVVDGRDRRTIERYLASLPFERRQAIEVVSIDPYEAYRQAVRSALPEARIVVDPFHLVRGANSALDSVRRERQRYVRRLQRTGARQTRGHGWRAELFRARHRLLKVRERLSEREQRTLCELFAAEPLIAEAWGLKERFRAIYAASDRVEAERRLELFLAAVERAAIPSFKPSPKTVVWSRSPKCLPIFGSDESVSSRERYISTSRG